MKGSGWLQIVSAGDDLRVSGRCLEMLLVWQLSEGAEVGELTGRGRWC